MHKRSREVSRLFDLEIDEVSLVDKPAINETFFLMKSAGTRGLKVNLRNLVKFSSDWGKIEKSHDESCVFCKITKEEEKEVLGMGFLKSVCFNCAVERADKGVFDQCIQGTFDFDKYQKENPEEFKTKEEAQDTKEEVKSEEETEKENEDTNQEETKSEDTKEEEKKEEEPAKTDTHEKRIGKVEKNLSDVMDMLSESLSISEQSGQMLNELAGLILSSMDMLMMLAEENPQLLQRPEEDGEMEEGEMEMNTSFKNLRDEISKFFNTSEKAGAKISAGRLRMLRDIAEKLAQLITEVDQKRRDNKKRVSQSKSVDVLVEGFKGEVTVLKSLIENSNKEISKDFTEKLSELEEKLKSIENLGFNTSSIQDSDENDDVVKSPENVFEGLVDRETIFKCAQSRGFRK